MDNKVDTESNPLDKLNRRDKRIELLYTEHLIRTSLGLPCQPSQLLQEYIAQIHLEQHAKRLDAEYM